MEILHNYKGEGGNFFILEDNKEAAEMTYTWAVPEYFRR